MPKQQTCLTKTATLSVAHENGVTLAAVFQLVTCCCVFFAVLRFSPLWALLLTVVLAPSLIRTAYVSASMQRKGEPITLRYRIKVFAEAVAGVLLIIAVAVAAFALVSLMFGLLGAIFGFAVSSTEYMVEAGVIGAVGGMIWGVAGAVIAASFTVCKLWIPLADDAGNG